jgi:hypothetical protein
MSKVSVKSLRKDQSEKIEFKPVTYIKMEYGIKIIYAGSYCGEVIRMVGIGSTDDITFTWKDLQCKSLADIIEKINQLKGVK